MNYPTALRTLLITLCTAAALLLVPGQMGAESQPGVTPTVTSQATAPRRTFSWPTVTPTATPASPGAATAPITGTVGITATGGLTATVTGPVTGPVSTTMTPTVAVSTPVSAPLPVRLRIPAIGVDTAIEAVGRDRSGRMETPSLVDEVAWYEPGVAPGEIGNAVLAGHLDRIGGAPAVFWQLGRLAVGDDIYVTDSGGRELRFRVTAAESYPYDAAPLDDIFGFAIRSRLNLITCRGKWDRAGQTYTQRLVVYSELVGEQQVGLG